MILRPRDRQRRLTGLAAGVDVRTRLDQQRDELLQSALDCCRGVVASVAQYERRLIGARMESIY